MSPAQNLISEFEQLTAEMQKEVIGYFAEVIKNLEKKEQEALMEALITEYSLRV